MLTNEQTEKLEKIANKMGVSISDLLKDGQDPNVIIESYEKQEFKILSE